MEFELLTIRQAVKKKFSFMTASAIHVWLLMGIFRPYIYKPPPAGPGHGCKLDLSDLVTVGILHSLFSLGVKFDTFRLLSGADVPSSTVIFEREIPGAAKLNSIGGRMPPKSWIEQTPASNIGAGREIQSFLKEFNYKVLVSVTRSRVLESIGDENYIRIGEGLPPTKHVVSTIFFYPHTEDFKAEHFDYATALMPYESVSFINAEHWLLRIEGLPR